MTATTRSESALIRPFSGISAADTPLEKVRFVVNDTEYESGAVVLPAEDLGSARLAVRLPTAFEVRSQVEKTPVPTVDCGLVVMATAKSHRVSQVLVQAYLRTGEWPDELVIDRGDADLIFNDRAGFTLTVAVVLLNELTPAPLRPNMAGTWLARRDFKVSPEDSDTSFSPEELTDEIRAYHRLPAGVLRYIHVDGVLDEEALSDTVHVYVDPEILHLLLANSEDAPAVQLQIELAIQATETVAAAIAKELAAAGSSPTADALSAYPPANRFYENLAATINLSVADTIELATNQVAVLRALLEAAFDMRNATSAALKER